MTADACEGAARDEGSGRAARPAPDAEPARHPGPAPGGPGRAAPRIAGAPISWGVCEVPGWGHQLAPARVLAEMRDVGLTAVERGPAGFLPDDPAARAELLGGYLLAEIGGFVPLVLHEADRDPVADADALLAAFRPGTMVVLAAATGLTGYDGRPELGEAAWARLLANLDRVAERAGEHGLTATLHPHVGTMVEGPGDLDRVLRGCRIGICLDTGHLLIGGTDPMDLVRRAPERIGHVHLKDVDAALARRVRDGAMTYTEAVRSGVYRPLGAGDIDVAGLVSALADSGYSGWYVLEQDTVLAAEPAAGAGPIGDVAAGLAFLGRVRA